MKITLQSINKKFSNNIFSRGMEYYNSGYVCYAMKFGNRLYAKVIGSADSPYSVEINLKTFDSECTCPYSVRCKHAVAVLLFYMKKRNQVIDADMRFAKLEKLSKEELLSMIKKMMENEPELFLKLELSGSGIRTIKPVLDSFGYAISGDFDSKMQQMEIIKLARFMKKNIFNLEGLEKTRLCIEFLREIRKYFDDVDDSNGYLGEIDNIGEKERTRILDILKKLAKEDKYGYFEELEYELKEMEDNSKKA